jgi:hypothetical protein
MLKENIMKIRGINDKLVGITGGKTSAMEFAGKKAKTGTLSGAIRLLMTDFQSDRYNGKTETQWDCNRVSDFNDAGIRIKQPNQSKMELKGAIDLTKDEKSIISKIRKFQTDKTINGVITDKTTWYDIKMAVAPQVSDERKALNKEIKAISDKNVQKMVDIYRAYETAREQFDTFIAQLNAQKKQAKKAK